MARLRQLEARTATLRPRLTYATDAHGHSKQAEPWRPWYNTKRWRDLRSEILLRDMYTCARCGSLEGNTALLVCDHKRAHHGDPDLFWSETNLQTMCKPCHDGPKQRQDRGGGR